MKLLAKLVCSVSLCLLTGFLGYFLTMDSVSTWYAELSKPSFTPPEGVFGVVWPILCMMMGLNCPLQLDYVKVMPGNKVYHLAGRWWFYSRNEPRVYTVVKR